MYNVQHEKGDPSSCPNKSTAPGVSVYSKVQQQLTPTELRTANSLGRLCPLTPPPPTKHTKVPPALLPWAYLLLFRASSCACTEMNKTYLRYELSETFGVVASPQSNAVFDSTGNLAISAALHDVAVWNLRQCSLVRMPQERGGLERATEMKPWPTAFPLGRRVSFLLCCGSEADVFYIAAVCTSIVPHLRPPANPGRAPPVRCICL